LSFSKSQLKAIQRFKSQEKATQTLFLQDKQVKRLCASWEFITRHITPDKGKAPKDDNEAWAWLWAAVKISLQELAWTTGGRDRVLSALAIARANRLIYPDGTVNQFVAQNLNPTIEDDGRPPIMDLSKPLKKNSGFKGTNKAKGPDKKLSLSLIKPLL
jgi:hypothetical protein